MSRTCRCLPFSPLHSPVTHNCRSAPTSIPFSEPGLIFLLPSHSRHILICLYRCLSPLLCHTVQTQLLQWMTEPSKVFLYARRTVISYDPLSLVMVVSRNIAVTLLVIKCHGPQSIQFPTQSLYHSFELGVILPEPASLLLNRLYLFTLPRAALGCCHLVLLAVALFPLGSTGFGFADALTLVAFFTRFLGFAMPLVCCVASSTCLLALLNRGGDGKVADRAV